MSPRARAVLQICLLGGIVLLLWLLFPRAFAFTEMAARELVYLWWLVLLIALALWLIWGVGKRKK